VNDLLVMKFGGTSVGSAERMRVVRGSARNRSGSVRRCWGLGHVQDHRPAVDSMRHAEAGDTAGSTPTSKFWSKRHAQACRELLSGSAPAAGAGRHRELLTVFRRITGGMLLLNDRPPRSVDEALAIGERLSALLVAAYLESEGVRAVASTPADAIVTDAVYAMPRPVMEATREKARQSLCRLLTEGILPVVTGFNGATADGRPTTLGRGGSEFSAAILAAPLDAARIVDLDRCRRHHDGRSASLFPKRAVLSEVTYSEAADGLQRRKCSIRGRLRRWTIGNSGVEQEQLRHREARHQDREQDSRLLRRPARLLLQPK